MSGSNSLVRGVVCSIMASALLFLYTGLTSAQGEPPQHEIGRSQKSVQESVAAAESVIAEGDIAETCAAQCLQTAKTCLLGMEYCEAQGERFKACAQACRDCSQICRLTGETESRQSQLHEALMPVCVKACEICIAECERHDDDQLRACVESCKACISACKSHLGEEVKSLENEAKNEVSEQSERAK